MGLLDNFMAFAASDEGSGLAQGLLSANGSQGIAAGLAGMQRAKQMQQEMEMKRQFQAMQMQEMQAQAMQRKAQADQLIREQARIEGIQKALPGLYGGGATQGAISFPDSGGIPMTSQPQVQTPSVSTPRQFDAIRAATEFRMKPEEIEKYAKLTDLGRPEVARTVDGKDAQGRPVTIQYDKFGNAINQTEQWKAPMQIGTGSKQNLVDPVTNQVRASFAMEQDPNSKASNALGWANHSLSRQRMAFDQAQGDKPQYVAELGGFVAPRSQQFMPVKDAQGNVMEGAGPKMTEDQGKATGWLVQASAAFKNMKDAVKNNPDASRPGFNDALAAIPSMGLTSGMANMMRGEDRQKYLQGSSAFSEAALRAATGAGVNKEEAIQKIRELTPVIGDSEAVIAQKEASMVNYLESFKVRAGPGAKKAAAIIGGNSSAGSSGGWSIQKVN